MRHLGNIIKELSGKEKGVGGNLQKCAILGSWGEVVGERIAQKSEPISFLAGTLIVNVESPAWANELLFLKKDIIDKINFRTQKRSPAVKDIKFKIGTMEKPREFEAQVLLPELPAGDLIPQDILGRIEKKRRQLATARLAGGWRQCGVCGGIFEGPEEFCFLCQKARRDDRKKKMLKLIRSTPWEGYARIKQQIPDATRQEYEKIQHEFSSYLKDEMFRMVNEINRKKGGPELKGALRRLAADYTLLKSGKEPLHLKDDLVREIVGDKIFSLLNENQKGKGRRLHGAPR